MGWARKLTFKPIVSEFSNSKEEMKWRPMVVWPVKLADTSPKVLLFVIGSPLRSIDDVVLVAMLFLQKV